MELRPTLSDDFDFEERAALEFSDESARQGCALLDQMKDEDEAHQSQSPRPEGGDEPRITP
jgi:hypothetical protein